MKVAVMIPTYNERENIVPLINSILHIKEVIIVIVDDNSPDGTWKIVKEISHTNPRVHLVHRTTDKGRGSAGVAGFKYCLDLGVDIVIEMDADFSHHPKYIPDLINEVEKHDLVLGSRYVKGGEDRRGWLRKLITALGGAYLRAIMGYKIMEPTSGYRAYKSHSLKALNLNKINSKDQFIVTEVLYKAHKLNLDISEAPIVFEDRDKGKSKLKSSTMLKYLFSVLKLRLSRA